MKKIIKKTIVVLILFIFVLDIKTYAQNNGYIEVSKSISKEEISKIKLDQNQEFKEDEILLFFKKGVDEKKISSTLAKYSSKSKKNLLDTKNGKWLLASVPNNKTFYSFARTIAKENNIAVIQPNYKYTLDLIVNDPYSNIDSLFQWHLNNISAFESWDISMGDKDTIVAVLDTGADLSHPDLAHQIIASIDLVDDDGNAQDDNGHGTHVCGIIAAEANNGIGGSGVAPSSKLFVIDVFDTDGEDWWANSSEIIEGINLAANNEADIINMSLGSYYYDEAYQAAVEYANSRGVIVVAAAGNSSTSLPHYPSDYPTVISVVATDEDNIIASFSNYGDTKDVCAPGVGIYSTELNGDYVYMSGTSMAAPIVSGVIALMLSHRPELSVNEVKNILYNTATDLGNSGRDNYYGHGLVNAEAALNGDVDPSF